MTCNAAISHIVAQTLSEEAHIDRYVCMWKTRTKLTKWQCRSKTSGWNCRLFSAGENWGNFKFLCEAHLLEDLQDMKFGFSTPTNVSIHLESNFCNFVRKMPFSNTDSLYITTSPHFLYVTSKHHHSFSI